MIPVAGQILILFSTLEVSTYQREGEAYIEPLSDEPQIFKSLKWMRFYAAIIAPLACWLPVIFLFLIDSVNQWGKDLSKPFQDIVPIFAAAFLLTYFPLSSALCGLSASYFLRKECAGLPIHHRPRIGFWIRNSFLILFCLYPPFLCCLSWIVIPYHRWIFDAAFFKGLTVWQSEASRQLLGEFERPPETEE